MLSSWRSSGELLFFHSTLYKVTAGFYVDPRTHGFLKGHYQQRLIVRNFVPPHADSRSWRGRSSESHTKHPWSAGCQLAGSVGQDCKPADDAPGRVPYQAFPGRMRSHNQISLLSTSSI
ncbi:hypothetical protein BV22DRAFT_853718 [Leucogyrophana mollusca]|uniref:Uncharacterized protein n=1 Tax=Leucogyrophana mollusca TaxID=85980 RepID=A0ACB8B2E8_9AGAM|nr:hypothetical protein BV22DRAFT_853718 [Leucogyrophana mollusca]